MTEHPDAVELVNERTPDYIICPTIPAVIAALLQDSGEAGVRVWKEKCENLNCENGTAVVYSLVGDRRQSTCPTCQGQGFSIRVSVLEQQGEVKWAWSTASVEFATYRDRPIKEG